MYQGTGIIFNCVYLSLFIITKSLLLFKLNQLKVPIGKKPGPGDHESSLKNLICKLSFGRCPCAIIRQIDVFVYCLPQNTEQRIHCCTDDNILPPTRNQRKYHQTLNLNKKRVKVIHKNVSQGCNQVKGIKVKKS